MSKASILIVEDNNIVMLELKDRLQELGYDVVDTACSGAEAIVKTGINNPDLIIMDIRLKDDMDGIEAAAIIKKEYNIPFVYLTAHTDESTLQRAKLTEPYGYIIKPFEERELHSTIEMAVYKHEMERKLKESERWLSATLKSIGDALIATDSKGIVKLINPIAEEITGWSSRESLGQDINNIFKIEDQPHGRLLENPVRLSLYRKSVLGAAHKYLMAKDGSEIAIDFSSAPIKDPNGEISGVVLVFRDISERIKNKELLEKQRIFLRTVLDADPNYISVKNVNGRFELANKAVAEVLGTTTMEIPGTIDTEYYEPKQVENFRKTDRELIRTLKEIIIPEEKLVDTKGKVHLLQTFKRAIDSQNGNEKLVLTVSSDITELKEAEKALRDSEERIRTLLKAIPDVVLRFQRNSILYDYHALEGNILLPNVTDVIGKNIYDILEKSLADKILQCSEIAFNTNQIQVFEYDFNRNEELFYGEARILNNSQNEFILILKDVTDRKRSQLELKALNASKDKFFSIIAHDLRSPFNSILGLSSYLTTEIDELPKEDAKLISESISKSVKSVFSLLENLLQWSRIKTGRMEYDPKEIVLNEVLDKLIVLFKNNLESKSLFLSIDLKPTLKVFADINMLETILRNLLSNSIKFTNPGGQISLYAAEQENYVDIYVKDNGVGMSESTISRLFKIDESISTNGTHHEPGSGLGLILCKEFIELNNGQLSVSSKVGEGSIFTIRLQRV